jgi:hypothetical protein
MSNSMTFDAVSGAKPVALSDLTHTELEAEIAALSAQLDAAEHRMLALIRDFDSRRRYGAYGLPSTAAWLNWRVGLTTVAAREKVRVARALGNLPKIDAAFSRAEVSYSKVRAMTRVATPESEGRLLYMATQATAAQLEQICRGVAQMMDNSAAGPKRTLRFVPDRDGMVRLEVRLGADDAALLRTALGLAVDDLAADASAEASSAEVQDRQVQGLVRMADAFVAYRGETPDGRPGADRHQLTVVLRDEPASPEGHIAEMPDHGAIGHIAHKCLERLACDATLVDADTGRKQRVVSGPMRRALMARDGGCRFPGCNQRKWVDAHHIIPWMHGGPTTRDNLVILCTRHHRMLHEGGFAIRGTAKAVTFHGKFGEVIAAPATALPRNPLPVAKPPRAPNSGERPNYNWAVGAGMPR